jgi:L-lactate dehydrogenase complex protein LldF
VIVNPFHKKIRSALKNPNLRAALDANAEKRVNARLQAMALLPDEGQSLRRRAHAIRAGTIANLDLYLEQFAAKAELNGFIVHRAIDAAEAIRIVLEIASENGTNPVAKTKTMVSEEINLNHALESAGFQVVETDLGEYIVQLRGEKPSHILTPAVHLRRKEVGETFQNKLGIPYTEDIPALVAAARGALRRIFLEAEIGITGVNFGIVETGGICLVTNEGNGRMVTTFPQVQIALMGIERLAPTMDDLAVLLTLLPRAATGQKATVYTNLIHGPRKPDDADGVEIRHLILIDNGRERMRQSPLSEALLCIRCGACLNACPVFREIGGHAYVSRVGDGSPYPGPIGSIVSPGLFGQAEFGQLARASSLCGACKEACPVDIDLPRLLLRVRAGGVEMEPGQARKNISWQVTLGLRAYTWAAADPSRFSFFQRLAGVFSRLLSPKDPWLRMPAFTGWGYSKDLPHPATHSFRQRWSAGILDDNLTDSSDSPAGLSPVVQGNLDTGIQSEPNMDIVEQFADEWVKVGGGITRCTKADLPHALLGMLQEQGVRSILAWDEGRLPTHLIEIIRHAGLEVIQTIDPEVKVGLTGAMAAIAETGTLVLTGGSGMPLSASLLPDLHIAILQKHDIRETLAQILHLSEIEKAATTVMITGPSRTADIEMTLTIGVHGPRAVHVFCLD